MQRYFAKEIVNDNVILYDDDIHHIKHVMRMNKGDIIQVVYNKNLYEASINELLSNDIRIVKQLEQYNDKFPKINLIIPALKEQKLDYIFQKGTEIGVSSFIVVPFERSIVRYDERKEKVKLNRWKKICKEASEQSMRIDIPTISIESNLDFLENIDGIKLICSTSEKKCYLKYTLKNLNDYDKLFIVIGPEGGITDKEEAYYVEKGFKRVSLGSQIFRVETVPIFLASVIRYEFME